MSRGQALALGIATCLHGGLLAAAWWAIGNASPVTVPPSPEVIVAQWIPQAAPSPSPAAPTPVTPKPLPQKPIAQALPKPSTPTLPMTKPSVMTSEASAPSNTAPVAIAAPVVTAVPTPSPTVSAPVSAPAVASKPSAATPTPPRLDASQTGNPAPVYPAASKRLGEQGRVVLRIHVQADGTVGEMQLHSSSGFDRLDESAMRAVKRWIYRPARQGDVAIAWWYQQPVTFTLENSNAN